MSDDKRYEKEIIRILDQRRIDEAEAANAARLSDVVEKATGGAIKAANPKYNLSGTSMPYKNKYGTSSPEKYKYITNEVAKDILAGKGIGKPTDGHHGIWKSVTSPNSYGTVPQYIAEQAMGLKTGDIVMATDIEALGTPKFSGGEFFSPTQLSMVAYRVDMNDPKGILKKLEGDPVNILIKPDDATIQRLKGLISEIKRTPGVPNLTADEYRSLKDLIAYAGDAKFGDVPGIIQSTNTKALMNGTNLKQFIGEIEKGLDNLENQGLARTKVAQEVNKKMLSGGYKLSGENFKFLTYNGLGYDMPAMQEVFGNAPFLKNAAGHIDLYATMQQAYGDIWSEYYKGKPATPGSIRGVGRLENIFRSVFGMSMQQAGYRAHVGVDDVMATADIAGRELAKLQGIIQKGKSSGGYSGNLYGTFSPSIVYQDSVLKNGTQLFSRGSSYRGSELDTVIADGKVRNFGRATYKNRVYSVLDQFTKTHEGKDYFGVLLHNIDDDTHHIVARQSREELQAAIQRDFVPYSKKMPGYADISKYRKYDAARREYESIFVGEGSFDKAQKYMDAISRMKASEGKSISELSQKEFNNLVATNTFGLTQTQARHMTQFYKRIGTESEIVRPFLEMAGQGNLDQYQKDLAMNNLREGMDQHFGAGTKSLKLPDMMNQAQIFNPHLGVRTGIDATRFDTMERGISSILSGGVKTSNMNFANVVDNFNHVVADLVGQGVVQMDQASQLMDAASRFLSNPNSKTSGVKFLSQLLVSNVGQKLQRQEVVEGVSSLTRTNHIVKGLKSFDGPKIYRDSINNAKNMLLYSDRGLHLTDSAKEFVDSAYRQKANELQSSLGIPSHLLPKPISEELDALASSLRANNVYMNVYIDEKNSRGLKLAMYDKANAEDVMRNGLKSNKIAQAYIPLAENDMLVHGGLSKINPLFAVMGAEGPRFSTAQHQIFFKLKYKTDDIVNSIRGDNFMEAQRIFSKTINSAIDPLSSASRYAFNDLSDELAFSSKGANWLRSGYVNISPLINKELERSGVGKKLADLSLNQTNDLFRDILYGDAGTGYNSDYGKRIQNILRGEMGLNYNISSVKTELMVKGVLGLNDPRTLSTFGAFQTVTRENMRQAQNYYSLKGDSIKKALLESGVSEGDIGRELSRRLNPTMMTDVASQVYGDEITGLSVKTARMNDDVLKQLVGESAWERLDPSMRPTTYEGMGIMKASVAKNFVTTKEVRKYIDPGSGYEASQILFDRLQNGPMFIPQGGVTLGRVIRDSGGQIGASAPALDYSPENGAYLKQMRRLEDGRYEMVLDEIMGVGEGTKFMTSDGKKITTKIVDDASWNKMFKGFEDIDLIHGGESYGSSKELAESLSSKVKYAMEDFFYRNVTVGKMKREEAEAKVEQVIGDMLGGSAGKSVKYESKIIGGVEHRVLVTPGNLKPGSTALAWSKVGDAISALGANVVRQVGSHGVDLGTTLLRRSQVEEYADAIGSGYRTSSGFEGISYGFRELEMMRTRKDWASKNGRGIDNLYKAIEGQVITQEGRGQAKSIFDVLRYGNKGTLDGDYVTYHTGGYEPKGANQRLLGDLKDIPLREGGYFESDLKGTILDASLAEGKGGFIFNLTTEVKMGNKYVNSVFMPSLPVRPLPETGMLMPTGIQNEMLKVWRLSKEYSDGLQQGGLEGAARAEGAMKRMPKVLEDFYTTAGDEVAGSKGYVAKNILSSPMKHSGRFVARGYSVAGYNAAAQEGVVGLSEKRVRQMFDGVDGGSINEMLGMMGEDVSGIAKGGELDALVGALKRKDGPGLVGLANRYPSINQDSIVPTLMRISDSSMDNAMILTPGVAARLAADYDGDYISWMMPYLGGSKAKRLDSKAFEEMQDLYRMDRGISVAAGEYAMSKYGKDMTKEGQFDFNRIQGLVRGDGGLRDIIDIKAGRNTGILEAESRIQKTIGPFSNLSQKYRQVAELYEQSTGETGIYNAISSFTSTVEQRAISSKKLEDLLSQGGIPQEQINQYVASQRNLRSAMEHFDVAGTMKYTEEMAMFDDKGVLAGIEGVTGGARAGTVTLGKVEVQNALEKMSGAMKDRSNPMYMSYLKVFSSSPHDASDALKMEYDLSNIGNPDYMDTPNVQMYRNVLGIGGPEDEQILKQAFNSKVANNILGSTVGGVVNNGTVHEGGATMRTIGSDTAQNVLGRMGKAFSETGFGAGAALGVGVLGAWAVSGMMRGPSIEHQPQQGQEDQAPSSDGSYVNPSIYAGAPAGAGPTALVSSKGTGYEKINVKIRGNAFNGATNEEIAQIVSNEVQKQAGIDLNVKVTSQDNRQTVDRQWLQQEFALALKTGYVY